MMNEVISPNDKPVVKPPGGGLARGYLILAIVLFPLGITLPVLETSRFIFFSDQYSILETIQGLWANGETALAVLVAAFSILTPILKILISGLVHFQILSPHPSTVRILEHLGKWSFADVLIVALIIVIWSSSGIGQAASLPGLWVFAASAALAMLASGRVARALHQ